MCCRSWPAMRRLICFLLGIQLTRRAGSWQLTIFSSGVILSQLLLQVFLPVLLDLPMHFSLWIWGCSLFFRWEFAEEAICFWAHCCKQWWNYLLPSSLFGNYSHRLHSPSHSPAAPWQPKSSFSSPPHTPCLYSSPTPKFWAVPGSPALPSHLLGIWIWIFGWNGSKWPRFGFWGGRRYLWLWGLSRTSFRWAWFLSFWSIEIPLLFANTNNRTPSSSADFLAWPWSFFRNPAWSLSTPQPIDSLGWFSPSSAWHCTIF